MTTHQILAEIFDLFPTRDLGPLAPTCHHFHSLILRLLHQRLQIASGLDGHALYLDCHRPSDRLTASKVLCTSLGTDGLGELQADINAASDCVGQLGRISSLYTRFKPRRKEPDFTVTYRHPAGDVPGSRTYRDPASADEPEQDDPNDIVSETVTVDAHDLFSQLTAQVYLGKRDPFRGLLFSIQEVSEGTIRVWRHWLSRQCERKSWTDGEAVVVHHEPIVDEKGKARADSVVGSAVDPRRDPCVLWINTSGENVGIKFRVKERKWRRNAPVLFASEEEVAVSYVVQFEGLRFLPSALSGSSS